MDGAWRVDDAWMAGGWMVDGWWMDDGVAYIPESIIIDILDGCMLGG